MAQIQKDFINVREGILEIQNGLNINCFTIFKIDGTFVLQKDNPKGVSFIEYMMKGLYLIVINLKGGRCFTSVLKME